jgi:hypothetical protein
MSRAHKSIEQGRIKGIKRYQRKFGAYFCCWRERLSILFELFVQLTAREKRRKQQRKSQIKKEWGGNKKSRLTNVGAPTNRF